MQYLAPLRIETAFIEHYNKITKRVQAMEGDTDNSLPLLNEEDYDD